MFSQRADGREVCDAYLFMPEVVPIVFALLDRALQVANAATTATPLSSPIATSLPSSGQAAVDAAVAQAIVSHVLVFFFKSVDRASSTADARPRCCCKTDPLLDATTARDCVG